MQKGGFTLPGESGYEALTLELAKKWGADVIRDSDGTKLSDEILTAGYKIYSTLCIIREHNAFAKANPSCQMQTILQSFPKYTEAEELKIDLLEGYFREQFSVNDSEDSLTRWQVFDRTDNVEVPKEMWSYAEGFVTLRGAKPFHRYTVNFFAYRIWEEISMYNHITNNWDKEHLMQIDPIYPEVQEYLLSFMNSWCKNHPNTDVVRFTSMFYNFVWIWGESVKKRNLFTDWASYDFTVSPAMLKHFEEEKGYALTTEDFVNKGNRNSSYVAPNQRKHDYMDVVNHFVAEFGKKLVDIVHGYGKSAYVFYDDSWVGVEPYGKYFSTFGFDGIIKSLFSGFEVRLCGNVPNVATHELRLHPYLFPVGLRGEPTFSLDGDPMIDAKRFWKNVRRALPYSNIQRLGLGGYLHLVENYPVFCDYIAKITDEFRQIKALREKEQPWLCKTKIAVLTAWGKEKTWTCGGHYHECPDVDLINILESLSGLPVEVDFVDFTTRDFSAYDCVISAGKRQSAWSGGEEWRDSDIVVALTKFVQEGGIYLAVNEGSCIDGYDTALRMSHVLGIDLDFGEKHSHGRCAFDCKEYKGAIPSLIAKTEAFVVDEDVVVYEAENNAPKFTMRTYGKGKAIYLSSFRTNAIATRFLYELLCNEKYTVDNVYVEAAIFPESKTVYLMNSSADVQVATIKFDGFERTVTLHGEDSVFIRL